MSDEIFKKFNAEYISRSLELIFDKSPFLLGRSKIIRNLF